MAKRYTSKTKYQQMMAKIVEHLDKANTEYALDPDNDILVGKYRALAELAYDLKIYEVEEG